MMQSGVLWPFAGSLVFVIPYVILQSLSCFSLPASASNSIPFGGQVALLTIAFIALGALAGMSVWIRNSWWYIMSLIATLTAGILYISLAIGGLATNGLIYLALALILLNVLTIDQARSYKMRVKLQVASALTYIALICIVLLAFQATSISTSTSSSSSSSSSSSNGGDISASDATFAFINPPSSSTLLSRSTLVSAIGNIQPYDYIRTSILTDGTASLSEGILTGVSILEATSTISCSSIEATGSGAIQLPVGTTAERPILSADGGQLRFNSDSLLLEFSNGTAWTLLTASSSSGGGGSGNSTFNPTIRNPLGGETLLYKDSVWQNSALPSYTTVSGNYTMAGSQRAVLVTDTTCNTETRTNIILPNASDADGQTVVVSRDCPIGSFLVSNPEQLPWQCWTTIPVSNYKTSISFLSANNQWVPIANMKYLLQSSSLMNSPRSFSTSHDGQYVLIGTYRSYAHLSTDYGLTFRQFNLTTPGEFDTRYFGAMSSNAAIMYLAVVNVYTDSQSGVYRSIDYGRSWNQIGKGSSVLGSDSYNNPLIACSSDGQIVYTSQILTELVQVSHDAGETWTNTTLSGVEVYSLICNGNGSMVVVGGYEDYVYISKDGGESWTQILQKGGWRWESISSTESGQTILAAGALGMYISQDYGDTWQLTPVDYYIRYQVSISPNGNYAAYVTDDGTYVSTDLSTWTLLGPGYRSNRLAISNYGNLYNGFNYVYIYCLRL